MDTMMILSILIVAGALSVGFAETKRRKAESPSAKMGYGVLEALFTLATLLFVAARFQLLG